MSGQAVLKSDFVKLCPALFLYIYDKINPAYVLKEHSQGGIEIHNFHSYSSVLEH